MNGEIYLKKNTNHNHEGQKWGARAGDYFCLNLEI